MNIILILVCHILILLTIVNIPITYSFNADSMQLLSLSVSLFMNILLSSFTHNYIQITALNDDNILYIEYDDINTKNIDTLILSIVFIFGNGICLILFRGIKTISALCEIFECVLTVSILSYIYYTKYKYDRIINIAIQERAIRL